MKAQPTDPADLTESEAVAEALYTEDHVPNIDQVDSDTPPTASYRDWLPEHTRVITYSNGIPTARGDRWAPNFGEARKACERDFGRVLEVNAATDRWFFRVKRVQS